MKKLGIVTVVVGLILAVWGFSLNKTSEEKMLLNILSQVLKYHHLQELPIDDQFSERVYNKYLELVDPSKMYFLRSDIESLEEFRHQIDDEILGKQLTFYYKTREVIESRVKNAEEYCNEILEKPFDFTEKESIETDSDKRQFCKSEKELKEYWRKYLKYMALNTYLTKLERQNDNIADSTLAEDSIKSEKELEIEARQQIAKSIRNRFKRRYDIDEEDNFSFYLNAITASFGPHTQYFPPQQKENFDLRMTGTLEGIGAVLTQEDGYTKISSIVTGSACWRQGDLEAGDVVLKVAQGPEEPVDIVDAPMKEVLKLIRGKKGTEVRLTVEKPDGETVIIPIIRDVVVREETYAKSALITDETTQKGYGYINLPGFYAKFGNREGRNSSDDIRIELERLKKENVNGVILDLRNNGGGSLRDAVKMAGLFFEEGPVVQVKDRESPVKARSDDDESVVYNGSLVILINEYSASASEIVAAALKDYDRAIVIGSSSTYGKGTVQTLMDINRLIPPTMVLENPFGSLKYTVQQFYRVNGSSTQFRGVQPHIVLPDLNQGLDIGEKELDYALPWDSVEPASYVKWNHGHYTVSDLRERSEKRVKENELFQAIEDRVDWLEEQRAQSEVSLNAQEAMNKRNDRKERNDAFDKLKLIDENFTFRSLQELTNEPDSVIEKKRTQWQDQLARDAYIREAVFVLSDISELNQLNKVVQDDPR